MAKPVSQSRTEWVKKGTIVGGKAVKKGYVAQKGRPEKRVTARIRLEQDTAKRGSKGDIVKVTKGRYSKPKPATAGGGVTKAQAAANRRNAGASVTATPSAATPRQKPAVSRKERKGLQQGRTAWASGSRRMPGAGSDGVNPPTSAGPAKTSSARDAFISEPGVRSRSPLGRGRPQQATQNRPMRGERSRLQRDKSGQLRWVKVSR